MTEEEFDALRPSAFAIAADHRHERAERPAAHHTGPPPRGGAAAPPLRGLARAAGGARDPLRRGRGGGRSRRAAGAAVPRRGAPRRRWREGARPEPVRAEMSTVHPRAPASDEHRASARTNLSLPHEAVA